MIRSRETLSVFHIKSVLNFLAGVSESEDFNTLQSFSNAVPMLSTTFHGFSFFHVGEGTRPMVVQGETTVVTATEMVHTV